MLCVYECVSNIFRHDFFLYVCVYKYMYARTRAYKRTCTRMCVCFGRHDIHIYGSVHMYFQLTRRSGSSERCIKKRMSSSVASNTPVPGSLISCSGGAELRSGGAALAACASAIAADAVSATDAY